MIIKTVWNHHLEEVHNLKDPSSSSQTTHMEQMMNNENVSPKNMNMERSPLVQ